MKQEIYLLWPYLNSKYYGRLSITVLSGIYVMQKKHKLTGGPLIHDKFYGRPWGGALILVKRVGASV